MSELKRLTWKYFFKRKKEEIVDFFENWWGAFAVPMIFLGSVFQIAWGEEGVNFLAIIGLCMIGIWILILIIFTIIEICKWIKSNWKLATKDAKEELKLKRKNERRTYIKNGKEKN